MTDQAFFGWRVVGAAFTVAVFAWGVGFYGPSVYLHALHAERGWPIALISAAITMHFLSSAGIVACLPRLHARFGIATVTAAGGIAAGFGTLAWAIAREPWQLFSAALVSGVGWALTSGAAINAMVSRWFDRRRPAAIAMAFNGASVGGMMFAPLWAVLIERLGFVMAAALVGGTMAGAVGLIAYLYLRATPAALGQEPDGAGRGAARPASVLPLHAPLPPGRRVWGDRRFRTLSIAFALGLFAQIGLIAHLFSLLANALGTTWAGVAVSLTTAMAVAGRTVLGWLAPADLNWRSAAAGNFLVQVTGSVVLAIAGRQPALLLLGCMLFGLGVGNMISIPPLIAQAELPRADALRAVALVTAVNQAVFAFAPAAFGLLREATCNGFAVGAAASLLQAAAAWVVSRRGSETSPLP